MDKFLQDVTMISIEEFIEVMHALPIGSPARSLAKTLGFAAMYSANPDAKVAMPNFIIELAAQSSTNSNETKQQERTRAK